MANPGKILIVDDDQGIRELLLISLSPQGYKITSASDGSQALEQLETGQFDVVLLDLMLPGPDGIEILKHIRERQIKSEVIVITAYASLDTAIKALQLGAYDYVSKPFQINTVKSSVKRAVEKRYLEAKLDAIQDLSREMALSLKVDHVVEMVLDIVEQVLEFQACSIGLIDEERNELYVLARHGRERDELYRLPLNGAKGITVAAASSGELLYVPDVREDPRYMEIRAETCSELAVPLKVKNRVIGALGVESTVVDAFSQSDMQLVSILAAQTSIAIENARLHEQARQEIMERKRAEELQEKQSSDAIMLMNEEGVTVEWDRSAERITEYVEADREIRQRNRELTALNEIIQAINSTLDLQETLTFIADHTIRLMGVEASSLLLYDKTHQDLWFAAGAGMGSEFIVGQRLAMGKGVSGWVAQHGEPALVPDVSQDPRWFSSFDGKSGFTTRSILCVPLYSKDQVIGTLSALNKKDGTFTQEDLRLLSSLAASAVTAIENAQLFKQVETGREQLRALSHRLVDAQEAERARVARELHDETGQALSSLLLSLSLLELEVDHPEVMLARVAELEQAVDEMLDDLHRLAMNLRPASLDLLGLVPALEHYVGLFGHQYDVNTRFETIGLGDERLPPAMETAIYRIVQEALTNVLRHARASRIDVLLEQRGDQIVTIIEDDGIGFDPESVNKSGRLGLFGMRERAEMLGGTMSIESAPQTGTTILVEIPKVRRET